LVQRAEQAALMGSPNCSAAAWTVGNGFGNFETVIPYDSPSEADFKGILSIFQGKKLLPEKALVTNVGETPENEGDSEAAFKLVSVRFRATGRVLEAMLDPVPPKGSEVELSLQGSKRAVTMSLSKQGDIFITRLPAGYEIGQGTAFATATVRLKGEVWSTDARWIDNEAALARSTAEGLSEPGLKDLSRRAVMNSDQQQILEAIHSVSAKLLRVESTEVSAAHGGRRNKEKQETPLAEAGPLEAIDPAATLRTLKELALRKEGKSGGFFTVHGASLAGVMAMLFSREEEDAGADVDLSHEAWTGDNPEPASDEPGDIKGNLNGQQNENTKQTPESPLETRARFHDQLDSFVAELGGSVFAEKCDVGTMIQALAFPLLVCVRGNERGWLPPEALASIATRVVAVMFQRPYGKEKTVGLFKYVKERYRTLGLSEDFSRAVGSGTLWSALLPSLATAASQSAGHVLLQADALAQVFNCKELLAFVKPEDLDSLSRASIIPTAEQAVRGKIAEIMDALNALTALLKQREEAIYAEQGNGRRLQNGGSLLWNSKWGWHLLPTNPAQVYSSGYISIDLACRTHTDIAQALAALSDAIKDAPAQNAVTPIEVAAGTDQPIVLVANEDAPDGSTMDGTRSVPAFP
jgi:hypothetical protein